MAIIKRLDKGSPLTYNELDNNFTELVDMINAIVIPEIVDALNSLEVNKTLSAKQGKILNDSINGILNTLSSDDPNFDTLQKIINYIKTISSPDATQTVKGLIEIADQTEVDAGTDTEKAITPATLQLKLDGLSSNSSELKDGAFTRKTITGSDFDGDNYTLDYYDDTGNNSSNAGNVILGENNSLGNGFENFIMGNNNSSSLDYSSGCFVVGKNNQMIGAQDYILFGANNQARKGNYYGLSMGYDNISETSYTIMSGFQNQCLLNSSWYGDRNFVSGYKNILQGGKDTVVLGRFHNIGDGIEEIEGVTVIGTGADYPSLPSAPSFLIGNGTLTNSSTLGQAANNFGVMKSGEVYAFQTDNTKIDAASEKVLITKEYLKSKINLANTVYEDNASAISGGLAVNDMYRTADGTVKIVY